MSLNQVPVGKLAPEVVNAIIEIPANGDPIKYEVDKDSGAIFVDRFLATSMRYPVNYGYVPATLAEDGDPVDILVIAPFPLMAGCAIPVRPVGVLQMSDEKGPDAKILAVPADKLTTLYHGIKDITDVNQELIQAIQHFFERYKELEKGKWVKVEGWANAAAAKQEILASIARYQKG